MFLQLIGGLLAHCYSICCQENRPSLVPTGIKRLPKFCIPNSNFRDTWLTRRAIWYKGCSGGRLNHGLEVARTTLLQFEGTLSSRHSTGTTFWPRNWSHLSSQPWSTRKMFRSLTPNLLNKRQSTRPRKAHTLAKASTRSSLDSLMWHLAY